MIFVKNLTPGLKDFLASQGMNPMDFLFIKRTPHDYVFLHLKSKQAVAVRR